MHTLAMQPTVHTPPHNPKQRPQIHAHRALHPLTLSMFLLAGTEPSAAAVARQAAAQPAMPSPAYLRSAAHPASEARRGVASWHRQLEVWGAVQVGG